MSTEWERTAERDPDHADRQRVMQHGIFASASISEDREPRPAWCREDPACQQITDIPGQPWSHSLLCGIQGRDSELQPGTS